MKCIANIFEKKFIPFDGFDAKAKTKSDLEAVIVSPILRTLGNLWIKLRGKVLNGRDNVNDRSGT